MDSEHCGSTLYSAIIATMSARASAVPLYLAKPRSSHAELMLRADSNLLAIGANDKYVMDILSGPDGVTPRVLHNIVKTNANTREMYNIQFALTKALLAQNAEMRAELAEKTRTEAALRADNDRVTALNGVLMTNAAHSRAATAATEIVVRSQSVELYHKQCEIECMRSEIDRLVAAASAAARQIMPAAAPDDRFLAAYNNIMGDDESCATDDESCATDDVSTPAPEPTLESLLTALAEKRQQEYQQQ
jgi:hypothetical protein